MLIVALACTDLLTAFSVIPLTVDAVINSRRRFGEGVCRFQTQISIYLMALTAFNWYLYVKKRNLYKNIYEETYIASYYRHLDSGAGHQRVPQSSFAGRRLFCPGYLLCWRRMMSPAAIYLFNAWLYGSLVISYVVILVCYWKVFRAVEQRSVAVAPSLNQASQNTQATNHSEEVSVAKTVGSIVLAFTICWIPSEVMDTMDKINPLLLPRQVRFFMVLI